VVAHPSQKVLLSLAIPAAFDLAGTVLAQFGDANLHNSSLAYPSASTVLRSTTTTPTIPGHKHPKHHSRRGITTLQQLQRHHDTALITPPWSSLPSPHSAKMTPPQPLQGLMYVAPSLFMLLRCCIILVVALLRVEYCSNYSLSFVLSDECKLATC
jgi:hypothetical protein